MSILSNASLVTKELLFVEWLFHQINHHFVYSDGHFRLFEEKAGQALLSLFEWWLPSILIELFLHLFVASLFLWKCKLQVQCFISCPFEESSIFTIILLWDYFNMQSTKNPFKCILEYISSDVTVVDILDAVLMFFTLWADVIHSQLNFNAIVDRTANFGLPPLIKHIPLVLVIELISQTTVSQQFMYFSQQEKNNLKWILPSISQEMRQLTINQLVQFLLTSTFTSAVITRYLAESICCTVFCSSRNSWLVYGATITKMISLK